MTETQSAQEKIEEEFLDTCNDFRWQRSEHNIMNMGGNINFDFRDDFEELLNYIKSQGFHIGKWLPIEEAPKGQSFLVSCREAEGEVCGTFNVLENVMLVRSDDYNGRMCASHTDYYAVTPVNPTNFMPLPPVPEGEGK